MRETDTELLEVIGGFSSPSKMPCLSYSLPAASCPLGSLLRKVEGSTCEDCYAHKGMYVMPNVKEAMGRRLAIVEGALADPARPVRWVRAFSTLLNRKAERTRKRIERGLPVGKDGRYFRWHDSGDLLSMQHLRLIALVAMHTPGVKHWLPTREHKVVEQYFATYGVVPRNLTIRVSVPMKYAEPSPALLRLAEEQDRVCSSGVARKGEGNCPAMQQDGECRDCRRCWNPYTEHVTYDIH